MTARAPRRDTPRRAAATHTHTHERNGPPPPNAGIEDLREKREAVNTAILKEEEEKAKIQKDLSILTDRLSKINEALARRVMARNEYDKTIQETEGAYAKVRPLPLLPSHLATRPPIPSYPRGRLGELIPAEPNLRDVPRAAAHGEPYSPLALLATWQIMESSQTLLHVLKRESTNLTKKTQGSS